MKYAIVPSLAALALALPQVALAQQVSPNDFRLPPDTRTPTPNPNVQGPVDTEGPVPIRPRVIPTASPTPTATRTAAPAPSPTATPRIRLPETQAVQPARPASSQPTPRTTAPATRNVPLPAPSPLPEARDTSATQETDPAPPVASDSDLSAVSPVPGAVTPSVTAPAAGEEDGGSLAWLWVVLGLLALGIGGFFAWRYLRGRRTAAAPVAPPIVRPRIPDGGAPSGERRRLAPLTFTAEAVRVSRSMMNVTLSYRITITNQSNRDMADLVIGGDLVSAHGRVPVDEQVAGSHTSLQQVQKVEHLAAGEKKVLTGDIRLPVQQIRPLRQGNSPLLVPLLRLRVDGEGLDPLVHTYVVGIKPPQKGARLQPFRLDETPQGYSRIGLRALA